MDYRKLFAGGILLVLVSCIQLTLATPTFKKSQGSSVATHPVYVQQEPTYVAVQHPAPAPPPPRQVVYQVHPQPIQVQHPAPPPPRQVVYQVHPQPIQVQHPAPAPPPPRQVVYQVHPQPVKVHPQPQPIKVQPVIVKPIIIKPIIKPVVVKPVVQHPGHGKHKKHH